MSNEITYDPTFSEPYRVRVLEKTFLSERLKHYSGEYGMVVKRYSNMDVLVKFEDGMKLLFTQNEVEVSA